MDNDFLLMIKYRGAYSERYKIAAGLNSSTSSGGMKQSRAVSQPSTARGMRRHSAPIPREFKALLRAETSLELISHKREFANSTLLNMEVEEFLKMEKICKTFSHLTPRELLDIYKYS